MWGLTSQSRPVRYGATVRATWQAVRSRFAEDRLGLTAGSLTFTTLISLVPLVTVMLAIFTAFPMFSAFQASLEKLFLQHLVPEAIARPVLGALTQFASKANRIGVMGLLGFIVTALALILTIDRALNRIWRAPRRRSWGQQMLIYWSALTLGPLVMGALLTLASYALSTPAGWKRAIPWGHGAIIDMLQLVLLTAAMAGLYRLVPQATVRWRHALAGGLFVALAFEAAKAALAWYISKVPAYSVIYGAFASLPILLLWIYVVWVIVLAGAVVAAYAPTVTLRLRERPAGPGRDLALCIEVLSQLDAARRTPGAGLSAQRLSEQLQTDPLQVADALATLLALNWVAALDEPGAARYVLLVDPALTVATPLLNRTLLGEEGAMQPLRQRADMARITVAELLG